MAPLPENWLADEMADAAIAFMASHNRGDVPALSEGSISETEKLRLLSRLDGRFKSWAGESLIGFICRNAAGRATLAKDGEGRNG